MTDRVLVLLNDLSFSEYSLLQSNSKKVLTSFDLDILYVEPVNPIFTYLGLRPQESLEREKAMDSHAKKMVDYAADLFQRDASRQWITAGKVESEAYKLANKLHANYLVTSTTHAGLFKGLFSCPKFSRACRAYPVKEFIALLGHKVASLQSSFMLQCAPAG